MLNALKYLFCGVALSQYAFCNTPASPPSSEMLSEVMRCFEEKRSPEELIRGWKYGQIRRAFVFKTQDITGVQGSLDYIFATCPADAQTSGFLSHGYFPDVFLDDLGDLDSQYFTFGLQRPLTHKRFSLVFISCAKSSVLYPDFLKFFKLEEPSCEEVKKKQPSQYWETDVRQRDAFGEMNPIDDQFIRWKEHSSELDWVFRFNRGKCAGVLLRRREPRFSDVPVSSEEAFGHLDLREFTDKFVWVSDCQVARFHRETNEISSTEKQRDKKDAPNKIDLSRRRLDAFNHFTEKYRANGVYVQNVGLQSTGTVKTPLCEHFGAPWPEFGYFVSKKHGVVLRSHVFTGGYIPRERVESFVLNTDRMTEDTSVSLPHGLDIKPYLDKYPDSGVLYEHVRADGRMRIIVCPYIAYLYQEKKLVRILVCNDKNGPVDHGWSLQRGYYCYERMPEYYWPVSRGYCPAGAE